MVPTVESNKALKYLGGCFNFSMDNSDHVSTILGTMNDLMIKADGLPCHPKYKLLHYHHFILSKLSWHLTIAHHSKTLVVDHRDNIVISYVRKWLELPISTTINSLILSKSRCGINLVLSSTKSIYCQTVIRNALKSFPNLDIKILWAESSYDMHLQYDQFQNTKQVLKSMQHDHEERINKSILSQGLVILSIIKYSCLNLKGLLSSVQQHLPRNIFNISVKYLNITLPVQARRRGEKVKLSSGKRSFRGLTGNALIGMIWQMLLGIQQKK